MIEVLSMDEQLTSIFVINDEEHGSFLEKLRRKAPEKEIRLIPLSGLEHLMPDGSSVIVRMRPMALHQNPEKLREDVMDTLRLMKKRCGVILLFYGLCGNALKKVDEMEEQIGGEVEILRDESGKIVDDCISAVLGGTEEYLVQLRKNKGTFFLTPMWAANWREMLHKVQIMSTPDDVEGAKYVFQSVGYKKVIKLDTGLGDKSEFEKNVQEFADIFDFERDELKGNLSLIFRSYANAKSLIERKYKGS